MDPASWKGNSMKMRFMALLIVLTISLSACHSGSSQKKYFVAFSQCNNAEPYRAAQNQLMDKLFKEKGDVQLIIADAQQDNSKQIAQIETFIRQKPDLLLVAPNERAPLTAVMGKAMDAGLHVICGERNFREPHYSTYIRCDTRAIGRAAGEFIAKERAIRHSNPEGNI